MLQKACAGQSRVGQCRAWRGMVAVGCMAAHEGGGMDHSDIPKSDLVAFAFWASRVVAWRGVAWRGAACACASMGGTWSAFIPRHHWALIRRMANSRRGVSCLVVDGDGRRDEPSV